jgi:uncharacterized membrane protein YbaN (DUF454 family)
MSQNRLIYIALILLVVFLAVKIVASLFPILIFLTIFAAVYAFIDPDFRAKVTAALTYLKNRLF